jgi:hypothetical protein
LDNAEAWWDVVWNAGFHKMVRRYQPSHQERLRHEHMQEAAALATGEGIYLEVGVQFTSGAKP